MYKKELKKLFLYLQFKNRTKTEQNPQRQVKIIADYLQKIFTKIFMGYQLVHAMVLLFHKVTIK